MNQYTLPHKHEQSTDEISHHIPAIEDFQTLSTIFKQLSNSSRIRIFWILCHCEECVINISAMMDMSSPAVAHHLKLLHSSGLIESRRQGKETYYKAAKTEQAQALHHMIEEMMDISCIK